MIKSVKYVVAGKCSMRAFLAENAHADVRFLNHAHVVR